MRKRPRKGTTFHAFSQHRLRHNVSAAGASAAMVGSAVVATAGVDSTAAVTDGVLDMAAWASGLPQVP